MVRNGKNSYRGSLCLPEFCKRLPWSPPPNYFKMILQVEISGIKKKEQEKRPILRKFVQKSIKLHKQCVCDSHLPPGAPPSTTVDNGGDGSCQFLGLRLYIQILCPRFILNASYTFQSTIFLLKVNWMFSTILWNTSELSLRNRCRQLSCNQKWDGLYWQQWQCIILSFLSILDDTRNSRFCRRVWTVPKN